MGLLTYISYVAVIAAFVFVTLSLASGLLYVSELIEEHSRLAKIYGQRAIYVIIALHVVLYLSESLPFMYTAFSIICHFVYLQNFSASWPLISLTSISFLLSCLFVVVDHFLWFFYFSRITQDARQLRSYRGTPPDTPGFTEIASFFGICVWLIPLFLFLSLSANDNALPVSAAEPGSPTTGSSSMQYAQTRVSLFRSLFSLDSLPQLRPKASRRDPDGLLAPHATNSARPPAMPPSPTTSRYSSLPPPPRSPGSARTQDTTLMSPNQNFYLESPPRRTTSLRGQMASVASGRGSSLGLRRAGGSLEDRDS